MKYLFLLFALTGCARKNLSVSIGEEVYKEPVELIFTTEELKQFKNLKEGESIPPNMSKVALIDTNLMDFPKDFWNDPAWLSNYKEAVKNMPTNLSPQEATEALSNYLANNEWKMISNQPFHTAAFYALYHYAEQGADLSYKPPNPEENIYWPSSPILDMYIPQLFDALTQPSDELYTDNKMLSISELKNSLSELNYLLDKENSILEYTRYVGWQHPFYTEVYKLLVKKGLDLNAFIDPSHEVARECDPTTEDMSAFALYSEALRINPYTAYVLVALGYNYNNSKQ